MNYFQKLTAPPDNDLVWNIPEQKHGTINIIGGNSQTFSPEIKIAEFLNQKYPIQHLNLVLPDALRPQIPTLPNLIFLTSTQSGSFANEQELKNILISADFNLISGDLSKNTITLRAISNAIADSSRPVLIMRDTVDALASYQPEKSLLNSQLYLFASLPQLQKLFRSVYYPKVLLLSQSLAQITESVHKFTLSYPIQLITLHDGQIIIAQNGLVRIIPLTESKYSSITFWNGELAAKITALNLYNPKNFLDATISAILS